MEKIKVFKNKLNNNLDQVNYSKLNGENRKNLEVQTIENLTRPLTSKDKIPKYNIKNINSIFNRPFDLVKLLYIVCSLKEKTASGLDRIDNYIIKKLPHKYCCILLDLFNEMFRLHTL